MDERDCAGQISSWKVHRSAFSEIKGLNNVTSLHLLKIHSDREVNKDWRVACKL